MDPQMNLAQAPPLAPLWRHLEQLGPGKVQVTAGTESCSQCWDFMPMLAFCKSWSWPCSGSPSSTIELKLPETKSSNWRKQTKNRDKGGTRVRMGRKVRQLGLRFCVSLRTSKAKLIMW